MSDRHFYLAIAVVVIATWMLRWDITPSSGTDNLAVLHFKVDRLTGTSYTCGKGWCEESEISDAAMLAEIAKKL
jgi:hypothetical protein